MLGEIDYVNDDVELLIGFEFEMNFDSRSSGSLPKVATAWLK